MQVTKSKELSLREKLLPETPYYISNASDIAELRKAIGATQEEFARIIGVVVSTVHRWEKGIGKPESKMARKLGRLKEIVDLLQVGFQVEGLNFFFTAPHSRLQGDCPMDLLNFDAGAKRIKGMIEASMTGSLG